MKDAPERLWVGDRGYWGFPKEGATEYRRADLPVRVKPLVWVKQPNADIWDSMENPHGDGAYSIGLVHDRGYWASFSGMGEDDWLPTFEAAHEICQTAHDARIRAALEE